MLDSGDLSVIKDGLSYFTHSDATSVIINYINSPMEKKDIEDIEFLKECVGSGDYFYYYYYNGNYTTILEDIRFRIEYDGLNGINTSDLLQNSEYVNCKYIEANIITHLIYHTSIDIYRPFLLDVNCDIKGIMLLICNSLTINCLVRPDMYYIQGNIDNLTFSNKCNNILKTLLQNFNIEGKHFISSFGNYYEENKIYTITRIPIEILVTIPKLTLKMYLDNRDYGYNIGKHSITNTEVIQYLYKNDPQGFTYENLNRKIYYKTNLITKICKDNPEILLIIKDLTLEHLIEKNCLSELMKHNNFNIIEKIIGPFNRENANFWKLSTHLRNTNTLNSSLYNLCYHNKYKIIKKLINFDFNKIPKPIVINILCELGYENYNIFKYIIKKIQHNNYQDRNLDYTLLYVICRRNLYRNISLLNNWNIQHFQNKNIYITIHMSTYQETELYKICTNRSHRIIKYIIDCMNKNNDKSLNIKHFLNKNRRNVTELHKLCENNMLISLKLIMKTIFDNTGIHQFKMQYFVMKNETRCTALYWLCKNNKKNVHKVFKFIQNINIKYFLNNNTEDSKSYTELYWVCENEMFGVAEQIDGILEHNGETKVERDYIEFLKENI